MAEYKCGCPDQYPSRLLAATAEARLQSKRPLVLFTDPLPNWTMSQTVSAYVTAFERWSAVADIRTRVITDIAEAGPTDVVNIITVADLGGGGVLADQMLPNGASTRLRMRMNSRIRWGRTDGPMGAGQVDAARVFCHEIGHFLGHEHWPESPPKELMEPFISDTIIGPQPTEAETTARWFGQPTPTPPVPPVPPNPFPPDCCMRLRGNVLLARIPDMTPEQQAKVDEARKAIAGLDCTTIAAALWQAFLAALCPKQS